MATYLEGTLLAESIDEDGQQGRGQLLGIVDHHHASWAALQKA